MHQRVAVPERSLAGPTGGPRNFKFETAHRPRRNGPRPTLLENSAFVFETLRYSDRKGMPATKCPRLTAAELDLLLASADADDVVAGGGPRVSRSYSRALVSLEISHRRHQLTLPRPDHLLTNKAKKRKIKRLIDKIRYDAAARMNPQRPVTPPPPVDLTSHIRGKYGDEPEDESIIDARPYPRKDERHKRAGKARANSGLC